MPKPSLCMPTSTNSDLCVAMIQGWLFNCLNSHSECQDVVQIKDWVPTRLINVGNSERNEPARLVLTEEVTKFSSVRDIRYNTLSHRWSKNPTLVLTIHNIKRFRRSLPIGSLLRIFREAIEFTKNLGIQYIWIDSLCIIQGCSADWLRESLTMGDVYKHGYLNIAALGGAKDNIGLFIKDRDPLSLIPVPIYVKWKGHQRLYYCVKEGKGWDTSSEIEDSELN
jgi:hypothetical protein